MFTPNLLIDTVQNAKRTVTNTVIKDETLNKAAHNFIDAQTAFAKMLTENAMSIISDIQSKQTSFFYPKKNG
jgi:hypothetical protein